MTSHHHGGVLTLGFTNEDEALRTAHMIDGLGFAAYENAGDGKAMCALIDCRETSGLRVVSDLRAASATADLPIVAIVRDPWSREVGAVFEAGADDFVARGVGMVAQLRERLQTLRGHGLAADAAQLGQVVIADPEGQRRAALARHLRKMGFAVRFALNPDEAANDALVKLVVVHGAEPARIAESRIKHQSGGSVAPWIITGDGKAIEAARERCGLDDTVAYLDVEKDAAQVVFVANQLLVKRDRSMRRSARLSYETPVAFQSGEGARTWGYTYNISRGGIYVRTLCPPPIGAEVDVELSAPFGRGRVVVGGAVAWRQLPSDGRGLPPGFGMQFGDAEIADAAALEAGYDALSEHVAS